MSDKKLWAGRFNEPTDAFVEAFTASVEFDQRLAPQDIAGSIAHATMLARQGILTEEERDSIIAGLETIRDRIASGDFPWSVELEDVHMNIEAELTRQIGSAGKKLHTGRSRNDQVATDIRLWLRDEVDIIIDGIQRLQQALLTLAEQEADTILPGFTHLQTAQPVTFGHHMMAWYEMLERDAGRFIDCRARMNIMPLGAAALAGTTYPIDRNFTAELLGFDAPAGNSLDAVSDRDFAIEFCAAASILMMHLSRFSEELIIWSSAQFGFIELSDSFCTGSSIMPQKKNPDVPELIRGKSGRIYGHLMALLTPIAKAFITEVGYEAANIGVQVYGGHGFIREWGMEQIVRDARIAMLYEGTTGIQALDLIGRKVLGSGGQLLMGITEIVDQFCNENDSDADKEFVAVLKAYKDEWLQLSMKIGERAMENPDEAGAAAVDYMMYSGYVTLAYFWARMAVLARQKIEEGDGDVSFYEAKILTARFYFERLLPRTLAHKDALLSGADNLMDMPEALFDF